MSNTSEQIVINKGEYTIVFASPGNDSFFVTNKYGARFCTSPESPFITKLVLELRNIKKENDRLEKLNNRINSAIEKAGMLCLNSHQCISCPIKFLGSDICIRTQQEAARLSEISKEGGEQDGKEPNSSCNGTTA